MSRAKAKEKPPSTSELFDYFWYVLLLMYSLMLRDSVIGPYFHQKRKVGRQAGMHAKRIMYHSFEACSSAFIRDIFFEKKRRRTTGLVKTIFGSNHVDIVSIIHWTICAALA